MQNLFFRVSTPYQDLSGAIQVLTEKSQKIIVYEHERDTEVSRTHIHCLIECCTVGIEQCKKIIKQYYPEVESGNKYWSWKVASQERDELDRTITYMTKGTLEPKHTKGYEIAQIKQHRENWVDLTRQSQLPTKQAKPVNKTRPDKGEKYDELKAIIEAYGSLTKEQYPTLDSVRRFVFHWYWRRDGRIPPAIQYKRMAGSLYLRIAEEHPNLVFTVAMDEILKLWY